MRELILFIRRIIKNPLHQIVLFLIPALALLFLFWSLISYALQMMWISNFFQGLSTNMFGALILFLLIELFLGEGREIQRLNRELLSSDNLIAKGAIEKARMNGMLFDGTFYRQMFWYANWEGADLRRANLHGASLVCANLKSANLRDADIRGVDFTDAQFDTKTILPDGKHWQSDEDLERFCKD